MASLDFEAEKASFRAYYDENADLLEDAAASFQTLVRSLFAAGEYSSVVITGRVKEREESVKKFSLKYQSDLEKTAAPYEIKD